MHVSPSEWIPIANFALNTLFIPLLVLLVQIKTGIAKLETQLEDEKKRVDRIEGVCDRRHMFRGDE
jgi:hypothetical protein